MTLAIASLALVFGVDPLPALGVGMIVFATFLALGISIDRRAR